MEPGSVGPAGDTSVHEDAGEERERRLRALDYQDVPPQVRFAREYRAKRRKRQESFNKRIIERNNDAPLWGQDRQGETDVPLTWEVPEAEGGGQFLKLNDGDSALCVMVGTPFIGQVHRLPKKEGQQYQERFYCGEPEGMGCPICENPEEYSRDTVKRTSEGWYPVWVEQITDKSKKTRGVQQMMVHNGGWTVVSAYKGAKEAQEMYGEVFMGTPFSITRNGADQNTSYTILMHPKAPLSRADEAPVDVEAMALEKIRDSHKTMNYLTTEEAPESKDPFEEPEEADEDGKRVVDFEADLPPVDRAKLEQSIIAREAALTAEEANQGKAVRALRQQLAGIKTNLKSVPDVELLQGYYDTLKKQTTKKAA